MSEKNGKVIDWNEEGKPFHSAGEQKGFPEVVRVGDKFRFTFQAAKFILNEPDSSTVVVELAEIKVEADGTKTLIVVPS